MKSKIIFFLSLCILAVITASGCRNHVVPTDPALNTPVITSSATVLPVITSTVTAVVTPGTTVTPDATPAGKFRLKTINSYYNSVLQTNVIFTYAAGSTPTAMDQYVYDSTGNVMMSAHAVLDLNGNTISATVRDSSNNIVSSVSSQTSGGRVTRMSQYDSSNTLIAYVDFQYDAQGRTIREDYYNGSGTLINSVFYEYIAGSPFPIRTSMSPGAQPGAISMTYAYDGQGRINRVDMFFSGVLVEYQTIQYNAAGQITDVNGYDGNGVLKANMTNTYDSSGRLVSMVMSSVPATIMSMSTMFTYDANGNFIDITMNSSFNGTPSPVMQAVCTWEPY